MDKDALCNVELRRRFSKDFVHFLSDLKITSSPFCSRNIFMEQLLSLTASQFFWHKTDSHSSSRLQSRKSYYCEDQKTLDDLSGR